MKTLSFSAANPRAFGAALVLLSAVFFSMAGLFAKGVDAGAWDVVFWRALFGSLFLLVFVSGRGRLQSEWRGMGQWGWIVAIVIAGASTCYLAAFKYTAITNVSLIYAVTPLLAAGLAWGLLKERPSLQVMICSLAALAGVFVIVAGSLGSVQMLGDTLALGMAIGSALILLMYRAYPDTPTVMPTIVSSVILLPIAAAMSNPLQTAFSDILVLAVFGFVFSFGAVLFVEGARRLPSGESALLSTMEVPIAPVLAWLVLGERVGLQVALGGIIVFSAVILSQLRWGNQTATDLMTKRD